MYMVGSDTFHYFTQHRHKLDLIFTYMWILVSKNLSLCLSKELQHVRILC